MNLCQHSESYQFQSTLPQGERLALTSSFSSAPSISIHAPTRGATAPYFYNFFCSCISIHAPTRGATFTQIKNVMIDCIFQSTLPQGERLSIRIVACVCRRISIHAPTRGATDCIIFKYYDEYISIHAPTRGATISGYRTARCRTDFNPRSHKGSDFSKVFPILIVR